MSYKKGPVIIPSLYPVKKIPDKICEVCSYVQPLNTQN